VLVADDHPMVRIGVTTILEATPDLEPVGAVDTGREALTEAKRLRPHVLVLDFHLKAMDGIEVCAHLQATVPEVRCVMLTQSGHDAVLLRSFEAGAKGFLVKDSDPEVLCAAVRTVASGHTFVDPIVAGRLVLHALKGKRARGPYGLTVQEMRVLELLPQGLSNRDIARELGISGETVKTHMRHAMRKLQVSDRVEAAAMVVREGLA
jgi:DNA-binding NarL/FixJ family response regulator